jgi:hypothetical protein
LVPHGVVEGCFTSGPWRGQKKSSFAGRYPEQLCQEMAVAVCSRAVLEGAV